MRTLFLFLLLLIPSCFGGVYQYPSTNIYPWAGNVGCSNGIPTYSTTSASFTTGTYSQSALQTAISSGSVQRKVHLGPGVFNVSGTLYIDGEEVALEGEGPDVTFLVGNFADAIVSIGHPSNRHFTDQTLSMSSGYTQGSTAITFSTTPSSAEVAAGTVIKLYEDQDTDIACGAGIEGGTGVKCILQLARVSSVSGNTINFWPPLAWTYKSGLNPKATWQVFSTVPGKNFYLRNGLMNLCVSNLHASATANIIMQNAAEPFLKNVRSVNAAMEHVWMQDVYRPEMRESVLTNVVAPITSSRGYGINMGTPNGSGVPKTASFALIENNAFEKCRGQIMLGEGAVGNAIVYNYFTNIMSEVSTIMKMDIDFHSSHTMFNLVEGNIGTRVDGDFFHGSSSHNHIFRNWWKVQENSSQNNALIGVGLATSNHWYYVVGNIFGNSTLAANMVGLGGVARFQEAYPTAFAGNNNSRAIMLGYTGEGGNTSVADYRPGTTTADAGVVTTTFLHANYSYDGSSGIHYDSGTTDLSLSNSLLYASTPSWLPSGYQPVVVDPSTQTINPNPASIWYPSVGKYDGGATFGCSYTLDSYGSTYSTSGGSGTVAVTAGTGCAWTAVSNDGWITVTGGSSGTGNGTVSYSVSSNSGTARTGTITIAGSTFTVSQSGVSVGATLNTGTVKARGRRR